MTTRDRRIDWDDVKRRLRDSELALERVLGTDGERIAAVHRQRAAELAGRRTGAAGATTTVRVLTFLLGEEHYALPLADLAGLLPLAGCTPVPGGPPELVGVLSVRGAIRSVVDLGRLLGLSAREADGTGYVLLLRRGSGEVGLRVDRVDRIEAVSPDDLVAPAEAVSGPSARLVKGLAPGRLALLDPAAVLAHPVWDAAAA